MLTIHLQKLTNFAVDATGLSGGAAKAKAIWTPVLRRSVVVLGFFSLGAGFGHWGCARMLAGKGFATAPCGAEI